MGNSPNRYSCARRASRTEAASGRRAPAAVATALLLAAAGCSGAEPPPAPAATEAAASPLCTPAEHGFLRARLQGAVNAEIDWSAGNAPQCRGGPRPGGGGLRLLYKGSDGEGAALLLVFGVGSLRAGESARNVPVNVTVVREGSGVFFATQGDDKCALDEVRQEPLPGRDGQYLLAGRGYCTQPARAVGAAGSVLVSRFDLEAVVDFQP